MSMRGTVTAISRTVTVAERHYKALLFFYLAEQSLHYCQSQKKVHVSVHHAKLLAILNPEMYKKYKKKVINAFRTYFFVKKYKRKVQ